MVRNRGRERRLLEQPIEDRLGPGRGVGSQSAFLPIEHPFHLGESSDSVERRRATSAVTTRRTRDAAIRVDTRMNG